MGDWPEDLEDSLLCLQQPGPCPKPYKPGKGKAVPLHAMEALGGEEV
jgi:hypothetical protein